MGVRAVIWPFLCWAVHSRQIPHRQPWSNEGEEIQPQFQSQPGRGGHRGKRKLLDGGLQSGEI